MKTVFITLLIIHSLIHFLGFLKAFNLADLPQLPMDISRSLGMLWLIAGILIFQVILLYWFDRPWWPFFGLAAVVISQTLIIIFWDDAKFGTVLNILILLVIIPALGEFHFSEMLKKERKNFFTELTLPSDKKITEDDLSGLPENVQKWLRRSGVLGKPQINFAGLQQSGEMRTSPDGNWMPFEAEQIVNLETPSFIWNTRVDAAPLIHLRGRDKLIKGEGEMLIKFLSVIKVVDEGGEEKMNTGSMLRFLSEICWFPAAALNPYLSWEETGKNSARATLLINGTSVSGTFTFTDGGDFLSFEALRYYGGDKDAREEIWFIEALEHKEFSGYRIPNKNKVTWKLSDGDFTWLHLEVTELIYNRARGDVFLRKAGISYCPESSIFSVSLL